MFEDETKYICELCEEEGKEVRTQRGRKGIRCEEHIRETDVIIPKDNPRKLWPNDAPGG